jgi:RNA polymerase sigma factor (sigma-70 family)
MDDTGRYMETESIGAAVDTGDISAAEITMVRRIAVWAHKTYCGNDMKIIISIEDLFHTGIIGLLESRKGCDPERNPEAYAAIRVRGSILDALRNQLQVRMPKAQWREAGIVRKAADEIINSGGSATAEAIAHRLGWTVENVYKAQAVRLRLVQADPDQKDSERGKSPPGEILSDPSQAPEKSLLKDDLARAIEECLQRIINRFDRIILLCRLIHHLELKMLARVMKLSIEGVRQKEIRAKNQVKQCLESDGWTREDLQ